MTPTKIFLNLAVSFIFTSNLSATIQQKTFLREEFPEDLNANSLSNACVLVEVTNWPATDFIQFEKKQNESEVKQKTGVVSAPGNQFTCGVESIGYIPGQKVTLIFKSSNGKAKEEITIIPSPLIAKSSVDGAKIEAKITDIPSSAYLIELNGFTVGEDLVLNSFSGDEHLRHRIKFDGPAAMGYLPAVIGIKGGIAKYSITRSSGEILKLELPWGWEWMKYSLYYTKDGNVKSIIEHQDFAKNYPEAAKYFNSKR